ncbi:MAG: hypothetical protein ABWZ66_12455 [Pyrinomonadaceae bacterium]
MKAIDRFRILFATLVLISANAAAYSQNCVPASTAGTLIQSFGQSGDNPVPNAFVP